MRRGAAKLLSLAWIYLICSNLWSSAFSDEWKSIDRKIWERVIFDITLDAYRIYTEDRRLTELFSRISKLRLVDRCEAATLIVETKASAVREERCAAIPRLCTNYRMLLNNPNAIGAFFWMKGRPTIIFGKKRLKRFGLDVAEELKEYLEDLEP